MQEHHEEPRPFLGPAKMHDTDKEFFNDLFEAKLKYITTRPYWNESTSKPKLYS